MDMQRLLDVAGGALLPLLNLRSDVTVFRTTCKAARDAVAAYPWDNTSLRVLSDVHAWAASFPQARSVALYGTNSNVTNALARMPQLTRLRLGYFNVVPDARLTGALRHLPRLRTLVLFDTRLESVETLFEGVVGAVSLTELRLSFVRTGDWGPLQRMLRHVPLLTHLEIVSTGDIPMFSVADALHRLPHLRVLALQRTTDFDEETDGVVAVLAALEHTPRLQDLRLHVPRINDAVVSAFQRMPALLLLQAFSVCTHGTNNGSIHTAIARMPRLTNLALDSAHVPTTFPPRLVQLALSHVDISAWDLQTWNLPNLEKLDLSYCSIARVDTARALSASLRRMPSLTMLLLQRCDITADGMQCLADNFKHVPRLHTLDLMSNRLGVEGVQALAAGLPYLRHLCYMDLSGSGISARRLMFLLTTLPCVQAPRIEVHVYGKTYSENNRAALAKLCRLNLPD